MQDAITTLTTLDYVGIFGGVLLGIAAFKTIVTALEWLFKKCGIQLKFIEDKKADHALLEETAKSVNVLQERVKDDESRFEKQDEKIEEQIAEVCEELKTIANTSSDILKKIDDINSSGELKKQAVMEVLRDAIDDQCDKYINTYEGVPSSEVQWLSDRFDLYKKMGGNHGLEHKVMYCLEKLPILPD